MPAFWWTIAFNLAVLWVAVLLVLAADMERAAALPCASVAGTAVIGLVAAGRGDRRRLGIGMLVGAVASAALLLVLLVVAFVAYFVLGGHELS